MLEFWTIWPNCTCDSEQRGWPEGCGADNKQGTGEGIRNGILAQACQTEHLPAELLEPHIGDAGVCDVHVPEAATDGVEDLLHLHQDSSSTAPTAWVILQAVLQTRPE